MWGRDYRSARDSGLSDADMRHLLADNGLEVAEVDLAWWWLPGADAVRVPPEMDQHDLFGFGESELFALADAIGARSLNAVDVFGGRWGVDDATESFSRLCGRAAEHGLLVHLEFLPWSKIPDLATAWKIVREADRPNGGLAIDSWHFLFGSGPGHDDGRQRIGTLAAIPGDRILSVQLSDAPESIDGDPAEASLHDRLLPGDGVLDLEGLVDCMRQGAVEAPVGVEVFSDVLHRLDPSEAGRRAGAAARGILDRKGRRHEPGK